MGYAGLTVIFTIGICLKFCISEPHGNDKWPRPGTSFPQGNQQMLLIGIEQRLRGIDTIRHIVSHNEISLEALSNKIDLIEARLSGLQSTVQHKFDAIATAISSAEMKQELLIHQTSRKLQAELDRIRHKLSSAETRLETTENKIQNQLELSFQKVETKQIIIANDILKVHSGIDMLKTQSKNNEQSYNHTLGMLTNHLQEIRHEHADKKEHLMNLTSLVTGLQTNKTEAWAQSDAPMMPKLQMQIIKTEISAEAQKISSKMSNMYNDMWRSIKDLEIIFKIALYENNNKSRELHKELHQMLIEEKRDSENFLDVILQSVMSSIQTELSELQRRISSDLQRLTTSNEMQGDSCLKVKLIIENRVALILEKIYETFSNRTDKFSKQITEVEQLIKSERKQLMTAITKTNNIITLAQENIIDHRQLDSSVMEVAEKTDDILLISQEIQMQAQEINETLLKHQKTLKELKGMLYNNFEVRNNKSMNLTNPASVNNMNAIDANYSNGIIKIIADHAVGNEERFAKGISIPLSSLNQSLSTSDIVAVIGEAKRVKSYESTTATPAATSEEKDRDRGDDDEFDAQEEYSEDEMKVIDTTQLLLSYIKYLRGHLTPQEFLTEAVPGSKFESLQDMAKQLKRMGNIPKEMISNIEDMVHEQTDKDLLQIDKEFGNMLKKLELQTKYETLNEDENYDEIDDSPQRKEK